MKGSMPITAIVMIERAGRGTSQARRVRASGRTTRSPFHDH
jgi:hypothetical protein